MKKLFCGLLVCVMAFGFAFAAFAADDAPETKVIKWGRGNSGNILVTIAQNRGYLADEGIEVDEIPMDNEGVFTSLLGGHVDVLSNFGTNMPLRLIAAGDPLTIFGGFMLTGCMPVIARAGTEWKGVEDLIGKKVAGDAGFYAVTGALLDKGHDPMKEVDWVQISEDSDKLSAVINGNVDYAIMGTDQNFSIQNMKDRIKVVAYASDITPNYSCCRMETRDEFIKKNPNTIKHLLKALIRAQEYYEGNKEEAVAMMSKLLEADKDWVEAYMLNEHYRLNVDPIKKPVFRAWDYMDRIGILEKKDGVNLEDHINNALYKAALDEVVAAHRDENPAFYDRMVAFYNENN